MCSFSPKKLDAQKAEMEHRHAVQWAECGNISTANWQESHEGREAPRVLRKREKYCVVPAAYIWEMRDRAR
jgi:hypothetical protein